MKPNKKPYSIKLEEKLLNDLIIAHQKTGVCKTKIVEEAIAASLHTLRELNYNYSKLVKGDK